MADVAGRDRMKRSSSADKMQAGGTTLGAADASQGAAQFRTSRSAAEVAIMQAEGYADPGLAEHKGAGGKHLDPYWRAGREGLRPEDYEDEQARLQELEREKQQKPGIVSRVTDAVTSAAAAVAPAAFKKTPSAAEVAYSSAEGYADAGLAEHKGADGKHLDAHWHKGYGGLRAEGEDTEEEQQRLRELQSQQVQASDKGVVERAKEAVSATAAAAAEKASGAVQVE